LLVIFFLIVGYGLIFIFFRIVGYLLLFIFFIMLVIDWYVFFSYCWLCFEGNFVYWCNTADMKVT